MIVVLAKKESSVRQTVNFLERRGFAARYVASLNEAVELFSRKEADKLLLSANFPHPKVEMLPVLMNQSFQIETILFAEDSDRKTQARLANARTKHVLFGPVSGPVVMMKIRQIDRDLDGEADDDAGSAGTRGAAARDDESDIKIGGRRAGDDDSIRLNGRSSSGGESSDADDEMLEHSGETYVAKGSRSRMKQARSGSGSNLGDGFDDDGSIIDLEALSDATFDSPDEREGDDDAGAALSAAAQAMRTGIDLGLKSVDHPHGVPRLITPARSPAPAPRRAAASKSGRKARPRRGPDVVEHAPIVQEELERAELTFEQKAALPIEDKIQKCMREALAIVAGPASERVHYLSEHRFAALVTLRTSEIDCAFVVSLAKAQQTHQELFHRVQVAFFSLLRDHGVEFENTQTYSIFLDDLKIVRHAFEASEFVIIALADEIEIGLARVFASNPVASVEPYEENMHMVSARELPTDEPVTFSVFLHFKLNNKFIRYLKRGSSITNRQAMRLWNYKAPLLVEQDELEAYRRSYAAHSIKRRSA